MAIPRTARVTATEAVGADARLIELSIDDGFGFRGGQYVIVNTGDVAEDGKPVKRAYSFASADSEQRRVHMLVKRLDGGPGSAAMHRLAVGATLAFSGPWGKLLPPVAEFAAPSAGRIVVVATDTGITAAMSLVASREFSSRLARTELVWLASPDDGFLAGGFVRARVPKGCAAFRQASILAAGHPERGALGVYLARAALDEGAIAEAYLIGDGAVLAPARDALIAAGVPEARARLESFFNAPSKK